MSDFSKGRLLKDGRLPSDLTLEQVSQKLGVNRSTVSRWENDRTARISLSNLRALSELYGIAEESLVSDASECKNFRIISASDTSFPALSDEEHFVLTLFRKASPSDRDKVLDILLPYNSD